MAKGNGGGAIRVVVAATSAVRRAGLEAIIRSQPDFQLAASTGTLARLAPHILNAEADVVVVDSDSLPQLGDSHAASVVLLTQITDARTISRLLKAGVRSILPRESDPDEIVSAIYAAYSGHVMLSAAVAENLAAIYGDHEPDVDQPAEEITSREAEVLRMLAEGMVNKDIAHRLGISEHTVKFHISSILEKLGASTRTEAVTLGIRRGLIPI
jgi:two-component system, NarL family, response regulator YdfI